LGLNRAYRLSSADDLGGHVMRGNNATIRDFFLGGRSMPWWAVTGSIIATESG